MAHLDGAGDQNFVVHASAFAAWWPPIQVSSTSTCSFARPPDAILVRADHSGAKLMEDLEGCLIAR